MLTDNPNDPALATAQQNETGQHGLYLVLPEAERKQGFVRPYRDEYKHVGQKPKYPLRPLTDDEKERHGPGYVMFEEFPPEEAPLVGRAWKQADLDKKACNTVTTMGRALSETYARNPRFYNATFCCRCNQHLPVAEFVWTADGEVVGS